MAQKPSIIGSIVERKPKSATFSSPRTSVSGRSGFPPVQHRSKSTFARQREELRRAATIHSRVAEVPVVAPTKPAPAANDSDGWREQISRENEAKVAGMTDEQREEERKQVLERFGANISDVLKRARSTREKEKVKSRKRVEAPQIDVEMNVVEEEPIPVTSEEPRPMEKGISPPPSALASPGSSRPSSRADRRLRFAELDPKDVFVYESAPPSPKRKALALPPPDPDADGSTVSLGQWKGKMLPQQPDPSDAMAVDDGSPSQDPEEGTPEYIRRRFFPNAPKSDPNMAWMELLPPANSSVRSDVSPSSLRFDLRGNPIPPSVSLTLPTHLGLHHHAEGAHAGYTLEDIFLLSRSTVPAQRTTMLGVLARIAGKLAGLRRGQSNGFDELAGKEEDLRKRIVAAGLEAMSERGSVGARAIEVVWQCMVGWNPDLVDIEGVELLSTSNTMIDTLPLDDVLHQITAIIAQDDMPPESNSQLLSILHRLAQQSNKFAASIVETPKLLSTVLQAYLLTPIPPTECSPFPDPLAMQLLLTVALASRKNAQELEKLADSLLRFITFLPPSSPFSAALATTLLTSTLRIYTMLASYGLYCQVAGTALEQFARLEQYIISETCTSHPLQMGWMDLVEAWTVCAIDPHQTTPPHDIRWSQIVSWGWPTGVKELQNQLTSEEEGWGLWSATWRAQAAYLEGSKVNAIRGGEVERSEFLGSVKVGFERGKEHDVILHTLEAFQSGLEVYQSGIQELSKHIACYANVLTAVIRLWLACLPPHSDQPPASSPFLLPFSRISETCAKLLTHPIWSSWNSPDFVLRTVCCRQLSALLAIYLRLSKRLPDTSQDLWIAQAFSILLRFGPGDEGVALEMIRGAAKLLTPDWATARGLQIPSIIWERGGLLVLDPFLVYAVKPQDDNIGPLSITPASIKASTTQRLPAPGTSRKGGLPLRRDWTMTPLDHLLRSGDSDVFKSLPGSWDASEVEVTRASLFLTFIVQAVLQRFSLFTFCLSREEAIFGCMKVFMLEHGQPQNDSSEEVFRDDVVEGFMRDILQLHEFGSARGPSPVASSNEQDLEEVATRFLGPSVPFFQYYTDFVALYDAISFSHPIFARLLLPPTSMRYPEDYRKHLWCDFNHILRTIQIPPAQVLSGDLREYLYPIEHDGQILGSYLGALLKDNLQEFVRLVALHHIASNIWPDLQDNTSWKEDRASNLLKAVVDQGGLAIVREVMRYRQVISGVLLLPPACFSNLEEVRQVRMDYMRKWRGEDVAHHLEALLKE